MSIHSGFCGLPRAVQVILLVIPGVNWITEIVVRWSVVLHGENGPLSLLWAVLASLFGILLAYIDAIYCIIFKTLLFIQPQQKEKKEKGE